MSVASERGTSNRGGSRKRSSSNGAGGSSATKASSRSRKAATSRQKSSSRSTGQTRSQSQKSKPTQKSSRTQKSSGTQKRAQSQPGSEQQSANQSQNNSGSRGTIAKVVIPVATATVGVAGGVLLGRNSRGRTRKVFGIPMPVKVDLSDFTEQIGQAGRQFGKLASEVQAVREKAEQIGKAVG